LARIVLIDDEAQLRGVMAEILANAGHEPLPAANGVEGLELIRRETPDVVVCDVNMPGLDGYGVLKAIRADPQLASLPFLFLTSETEVRAGMKSGADDYLMKPVSAADLLAAIDARLKRVQSMRLDADRRVDEMRRAVAVLLPHELRTPLTTIIGSARLLEEFGADFGADEMKEMAGGILKAAHRLHRMAENYILYADLELWRLSRPGADTEALAGSSGEGEVQSAATEVAIQSGRQPDLEMDLHKSVVRLAPAYLRKVVSELADNAFKFSSPGTPVHVSLTTAGSKSVLSVVDHGAGMAADQVRRVGAFQQFDRARFEQRGSGVGLALVRAIIEATGGRFEITSRPAEGTTVHIDWPV
jgi:two-component system, sensor histidine kinase and response regulator